MTITLCKYKDIASLTEQSPTYSGEAGCIANLDHTHLALPEKISVRRVVIFASGVRTTQSDAVEQIGYCVGGTALVSVSSRHGSSDSFVIEDGEAIFLPSKSTHVIQNIGGDAAKFVFVLAEEMSFARADTAHNRLSLAAGHDARGSFLETWSSRRYPDRAALRNITRISRFRLKHAFSPEDDFCGSTGWPFISHLLLSVRAPGVYGSAQDEVAYILRGRGELRVLLANGEVALASVNAGDVFSIPADAEYSTKSTGVTSLQFIAFRSRHGERSYAR